MLVEALTGRLSAHHAYLARMQLDAIDRHTARITSSAPFGVAALAVARSPTAAIWERNTGASPAAAARPKPSLLSSGPCWSSSGK